MNPKQKTFCREYLKDLNATAAAERAGYSKKTARSFGQRLLTKVDIQFEVSRLMNEREKRTEITIDKVLRELAICGFTDIRNYLDVNAAGLVKVKNLEGLPPEMTRAIKKIKQRTTIRHEPGGGAKIQDAHLEFELYDKMVALDKIGNHLGMFNKKESEADEIDLSEIADILTAQDAG